MGVTGVSSIDFVGYVGLGLEMLRVVIHESLLGIQWFAGPAAPRSSEAVPNQRKIELSGTDRALVLKRSGQTSEEGNRSLISWFERRHGY